MGSLSDGEICRNSAANARQDGDMARVIDRRALLRGTAVAGLAAAACGRGGQEAEGTPAPSAGPTPAPPKPEPPEEPGIVRVASVKTAVEGALLPALITSFERGSALRVRLTTGSRVYEQARASKVDLVVSHYGHKDAEGFVLDGLGEWPRTIFSNQMALVGPPSDPAGVRGVHDLAEAFRRIASTRSRFLINGIDGVKYLTQVLWNAVGKPDPAGWMIDTKLAKEAAVVEASKTGAYMLWGLTPFLRTAAATPLALEPLVLDDPLLHRMMVSVLVKPGAGRRINTDGALAFQRYLLAPSTQAEILTIHYPGQTTEWVPAGRHNRTAMLPAT
jgi:tungstate transport system substrate-binding protein